MITGAIKQSNHDDDGGDKEYESDHVECDEDDRTSIEELNKRFANSNLNSTEITKYIIIIGDIDYM